MPVVYRLRQQRPAGLAQPVEVGEGTVAGLPLTVFMADQAAIDFGFHRQTRQLVWRNRVNKARESIL